MEPKFDTTNVLRTYKKSSSKVKMLNEEILRANSEPFNDKFMSEERVMFNNASENKIPLSTKDAVKYLLEGTLRLRVCRYCLSVTERLSELDEILVIAVNDSLHEVTIKDMVASFYPFKVVDDNNFPNKICKDCLTHTIGCYLFSQQCERAGRAIRNCFDDMYEKYEKLDPLEPVKKRGKRKLHPNYNILYTDHDDVINYAEPIINLINIDSMPVSNDKISDLECQKCYQVLPSPEALLNHEKIHPKSMWYSCKLCGKAFVKQYHLRKHIKQHHNQKKKVGNQDQEIDKNFSCNDCGTISNTFFEHLQHIEKHKFKTAIENLIERKVDDLCSVCMEKESKMVNLGEVVHLHGGYPDLMGDKTIKSILRTSIPEMPLDSYTGTKICDNCLNHAITSHVFIVKILYIRNRLNTCVSLMLDSLNSLNEPTNNIMVEIARNTILPDFKVEKIDLDVDYEKDEIKNEIEVLEDEFRLKSDSESESDSKSDEIHQVAENPAKNVTKTYSKKKLVNGFQNKYESNNTLQDICSEFLTFKKRIRPCKKVPCRYSCPFCNKHFVSDYFLKKHIMKHVHRNVKCSLCSEKFKSRFYLFEHRKMVHTLKNPNYISCKICGRTFTRINKIKSHQRCHKIKQCQLCDKSFKNQKHHDVHMQRHLVKFNMYKNHDVSPHTCSFCEKAFSNENELSLHVNKTHLQIKPYSCDMCDKQFYTENNLSSHKKLHSMFSKELCVFCNKEFKCRKNLVIHVRKHIGSKPHQCPVCRQSFYSDGHMKRHMNIFHGGRFCCRLCKTVLPSQIDLKNHINVVHSSM